MWWLWLGVQRCMDETMGWTVATAGARFAHMRVVTGDDLRRVVLGERGGSKVFACA